MHPYINKSRQQVVWISTTCRLNKNGVAPLRSDLECLKHEKDFAPNKSLQPGPILRLKVSAQFPD